MQFKTGKAFTPRNFIAAAVVLTTMTPMAYSASALEEVIVTARKRTETLQDVPFSINARTESQMRNSGSN